MHIGIDPGIKGAIAGVYDSGKLSFAWDMPTKIENMKTIVDVDRLADSLSNLMQYDIQSIMVEKPFYKPSDRTGEEGKYTLSHKQQMVARINSGVVYGMCKMLSRETKQVEPAIWKRSIGIPKGSNKKISIEMASGLFGPAKETGLHKDGRAEAAMIAYYGMRVYNLEKVNAINNKIGLTL